jgi:hypothetical protein
MRGSGKAAWKECGKVWLPADGSNGDYPLTSWCANFQQTAHSYAFTNALARKIKIIHAAWLRDPDTWPPGAVAPEPDDVLEDLEPPPFPIRMYSSVHMAPTECSSSITSPWTAASVIDPMVDERTSGLVVAADE